MSIKKNNRPSSRPFVALLLTGRTVTANQAAKVTGLGYRGVAKSVYTLKKNGLPIETVSARKNQRSTGQTKYRFNGDPQTFVRAGIIAMDLARNGDAFVSGRLNAAGIRVNN